MKTLKHWELAGQDEAGVDLRVDGKHLFSLRVLEQGLIRVFIQRNGELALDRTWSIAPQNDAPWEGRDRLSTEGFSVPKRAIWTTTCLSARRHSTSPKSWCA